MPYETLTEKQMMFEDIPSQEDLRPPGIEATPIGQALLKHFEQYKDVFLSTSSEKKVA